jgi:hypothetical protein
MFPFTCTQMIDSDSQDEFWIGVSQVGLSHEITTRNESLKGTTASAFAFLSHRRSAIIGFGQTAGWLAAVDYFKTSGNYALRDL